MILAVSVLTLTPVVIVILFVVIAGSTLAKGRKSCDSIYHDPPGCASGFPSVDLSDPVEAESVGDPELPGDIPDVVAPDFGGLPASFGSVASTNSVPNMIGDFSNFGALGIDDRFGSFLGATGATPFAAGGDRRFKVSENFNPLPQDRVYFNYNFYNNALRDVSLRDRNLNRYTVGFEKTFLCESCSLDVRIPFASGLDSVQTLAAASPGINDGTEFGNIRLIAKALLHQTSTTALTAGLGINLPTGDDGVLVSEFGNLMIFENEAVYLQPYLAYLATSDRFFTQMYVQMDFDANGYGVQHRFNGAPIEVGRLNDQTLLLLDGLVGYWLYRDPTASRYVRGIATVVELHYSTTVQDADVISAMDTITTNVFNRVDLLNITAGVHTQIGPMSTFTVGAAAPLRDDEERVFDAELQVQFNRRF